MIHELKVNSSEYARIVDGSKTFEIRNNKRHFQMGDTVILKEFDWEPINTQDRAPKGFTDSEPLDFKVGYIHVLSSSEVIFSLLPVKKAKAKD